MKKIVVDALLVYYGKKSKVTRIFENNVSREVLEFGRMVDDTQQQVVEDYWRSSVSQKYKHIRVFRQAINRIHFSETHTEREFGHMLHI